jgi:hydrophobic/amphiphilic exporter-1 (mainly G- bacteria), HAE1 family
VLACLVVLTFMRSLRATLIAAVAIPVSVISTFGMMWALGFTLNSVTMLALVLMVGIVIDDAIVVLENIFRFIEEKQMGPFEAAAAATKEIGPAVMATTFSLVVIFVPVSLMSSIAGRYLFQFGLTAAVAVLVSLLVSFTLTPMMASRFLRSEDADGEAQRARSRRGFYAYIERGYLRLLRTAMAWRWSTVALAALVAVTAVPLFAAVPREFVPGDVDEGEFGVNVSAPEGTSVAAMVEATIAVEEELRAIPGVRDVLATAGGGFLGQVNQARFYVRLEPHTERIFSLPRLVRATLGGRPADAWRGNFTQQDVMEQAQARLARFGHLRSAVRNFPSFNLGGGPWDLDFVLRGPDLEVLAGYAEELRARALAQGGFRGLDTSLRLDKPELRVRVDHERAADLGIAPRDLGAALRLLVGGDDEISRFRDPDTNEQYDVLLRLEADERDDPTRLGGLRLAAADGTLVELASIAGLEETRAPSRIDRLDRQRMVSVRGGVAQGFALGDRIEVLRTEAEGLDMPAAYSSILSGRSRELERTFDEFAWAFALSIVLMYLILASQFESFTHPFTILLSLPVSVPFALAALWLAGGTLNLYSALGMLVLFGVVKKNAILQIDHMNGLRAAGMERARAIIEANRNRLRPILMTTLSLVAGMLPLALGTGPGAEERRAVAVVVIGGQSLCLILTLLLTPVVYSLLDDLGRRLGRRPNLTPSAPAPTPGATLAPRKALHS